MILLPTEHAMHRNVLVFPAEDASWPEHYLSHVFFYDIFNQHFKPLSLHFALF
jgi:hypothetical protein